MNFIDREFLGEAGGFPGLVRITLRGDGRAKRVEIDDLVFKETDKDLISDLFVAALNHAYEQLDAATLKERAEMWKNLIPSGSNQGSYDSEQLIDKWLGPKK